ncbi:MFS transporter [Pseudonocardia sp. CA-107938]|uniref:MFS transporter n=1 Tax=Pseudonocardia sp. CA-107938 TaxID=3240021 RepID=UPI003D923584
MHLPPRAAFWLLATTLCLLLVASSAPSPIYVLYQQQWQLSPITLTAVYAANAVALLVTLLFVGSLSDPVGRRPVLLVALVVEIGAMVAFAQASDVGWLFVARVLQGIATGAATGAISATLIDLQPPGGRLGALMTNVASSGGIAAGALGAGLLVEFAPAPSQLVYWLLTGLFVAGWVGVLVIPETVPESARRDGSWRGSLRPRVAVPASVRTTFLTLAPSLVATWALGGLYLALGGSLARGVFHVTSPLAGGLVIVALNATSALVAVLARDWSSQRSLLLGSIAMVCGVAVAMVALALGSLALFLVASVVVGTGFGPSFSGVLRTLTAMAPPERRAEVVTAIYVVSYLALSLPAVAAGIAVTQVGLLSTAYGYGVAVSALSAIALIGSWRQQHAPVVGRGHELAASPGTVAPCPRMLAAGSRA